MHSLGDESSVGDATFSKFAVIITTMNLLLFMVPDGLVTVSVIVLKEFIALRIDYLDISCSIKTTL